METAAPAHQPDPAEVALVRLLYLLCKSQSDRRRWLTLLGIACGISVALNHAFQIWTHKAPGGFVVLLSMVYLPLASTLHTVSLARRILLVGPPAGTANA